MCLCRLHLCVPTGDGNDTAAETVTRVVARGDTAAAVVVAALTRLLRDCVATLPQRVAGDYWLTQTLTRLAVDACVADLLSRCRDTDGTGDTDADASVVVVVDAAAVTRGVQALVLSNLRHGHRPVTPATPATTPSEGDTLLCALPALLRHATGSRDTLWTAEVLATLRDTTLAAAPRLAHDRDTWRHRVAVVAALLDTDGDGDTTDGSGSGGCVARGVLEAIAEATLLPAAVAHVSRDTAATATVTDDGDEAALRHLLCRVWTRHGHRRAMVAADTTDADAAAALFAVRSWEPPLATHLLRGLFATHVSPRHTATEATVASVFTRHAAVAALSGALLGRDRRELATLLPRDTCFPPTVLATLLATVVPPRDTAAADAAAADANGDDDDAAADGGERLVRASQRLLATKLLEAFFGRDDTATRAWAGVSPLLRHRGAAATPDDNADAAAADAADEDTDDDDDEARAATRDGDVLRGVLRVAGGDDVASRWLDALTQRFDPAAIAARVTAAATAAAATAAATDDDAGDSDADDGDSDDDDDSRDTRDTGGDRSPLPPGGVSRHLLRQLAAVSDGGTGGVRDTAATRRLRVDVASRCDAAGSLWLWLATLAAIDTAAAAGAARNSLRSQCGGWLQRRGAFAEAVALLLRLATPALTTDATGGPRAALRQLHWLPLATAAADGRDTDALYATHRARLWRLSTPTATPTATTPATTQSTATSDTRLATWAVLALQRTVLTLPALTRAFWASDACGRRDKRRLAKFVEDHVRGALLRRELAVIAARGAAAAAAPAAPAATADAATIDAANATATDALNVVGNVRTGQITASFVHDEVAVDLTLTLPAAYPLKNVDVSCTRRVGVSEARWRRWVLQMIHYLSAQDGTVYDAAVLWQSNLQQELAAVEPCPICYCTLHTKTLKLPTFACPTCKHRFHPSCLHTWFKTSGKSKCVLCQQPIAMS